MKILSIETSCDDTGITIMEGRGGVKNATFKVLADSSNSQIKIHIPYGGVYPMLAKREHTKNLPILLEKVLRQAKLKNKKSPVDLIAVTYGPGLEITLWAGITFAQELAKKWDVPLIPTDHMEGHIFSAFGKNKGKFAIPKVKFPMLSLLVSGGHTQLILSKKPARLNSRSGGWMQYEIIGETLDDAVGEAYDKVARMLGLPYPGGPEISKLAEELRFQKKEKRGSQRHVAYGSLGRSDGDGQRKFSAENFRADRSNMSSEPIVLPRPMLYSKNLDFSFSGLKTAVLYLIRDLNKEHSNILQNDKIRNAIALEFENATIECLIYKTAKAIEKYKIKTIIVGGGVSANKHLQREMSALSGSASGGKKLKVYFPQKELTGDNALMIGIAGYLNYVKNKGKVIKASNIKADGNLRLSK